MNRLKTITELDAEWKTWAGQNGFPYNLRFCAADLLCEIEAGVIDASQEQIAHIEKFMNDLESASNAGRY